jgi:hypothetical protein
MIRNTIAPVLALAGTTLAFAFPVTASAHTQVTPKAVAWQVKELANKNLKFAGNPTRLTSVTCAARGGDLFVCKAKFNDGSGFYWPRVVAKAGGYLKLTGGMAI